MARHWAEVGLGTPVALHLFYVVKILLYVWRVADRAGHQGYRRLHQRRAVVVGADQSVPEEGRALHDGVEVSG